MRLRAETETSSVSGRGDFEVLSSLEMRSPLFL